MQGIIEEIVELTAGADTHPLETGVGGLLMIKGNVPQQQLAALYQPMIGLVVQGRKMLTVGDLEIDLVGPSYFIVPMHLPVRARVSPSYDGRAYISLGLPLNHGALQSLLRDVPPELHQVEQKLFDKCDADAEFIKPWLRMLRLMKTPNDIPALAPVYEREIFYRALIGGQGWYLRQLALSETSFSKIVRSVQWLRENYMRPVVIDDLARNVGMGVTTFHRQFKRATGLSPIQFQKQLRLLEARNLLAFEGHAVATAAYEVGYQSPSQFNREYSRFFGAPPARDTAALRRIGLAAGV